jgi:hypothetical protein
MDENDEINECFLNYSEKRLKIDYVAISACEFKWTEVSQIRSIGKYLYQILRPNSNYMCHLPRLVKLHFAHRVYLWVSYDSHRKQRLFP